MEGLDGLVASRLGVNVVAQLDQQRDVGATAEATVQAEDRPDGPAVPDIALTELVQALVQVFQFLLQGDQLVVTALQPPMRPRQLSLTPEQPAFSHGQLAARLGQMTVRALRPLLGGVRLLQVDQLTSPLLSLLFKLGQVLSIVGYPLLSSERLGLLLLDQSLLPPDPLNQQVGTPARTDARVCLGGAHKRLSLGR